MRHRTHAIAAAVVAPAVVAACADAPPPGPGATVRDSAGIQIVENRGTRSVPWTLRPALTIGSGDGDGPSVFGRVADVAVGTDGSIYVLDQFAQHVRVFDAAGEYVRTHGRPGQGPGELSRFTTDVLVAGDTVFVPDYAQSRISVFVPGEDPGTIRIPPQPGGRSWARPPGGGFVYRGLTISRGDGGGFEFWDAILSLNSAGTDQDTVLVFDYAFTELGSRENLRVPLLVNSPAWARLTDGRIVWTALDRDAVYVHDASGRRQRIVRHADWERRPVTETDRRALVELLRRKLERLGGDASAADGPNVIAPEHLPALTGIRAGPDNTFWVQRMGDVADIDPMAVNASDRSDWLGGPRWQVFDGEGRLIGGVVLPPRFRITRITVNAVYGIGKDADDVERVHRLDRVSP